MTLAQLAGLAVLAPAIAALLALLPPLRHRGWPSAAAALAGSAVSLGAAVAILVQRAQGAGDARWVTPWLVAGGKSVGDMGVLVDGVSAPMLVVVTIVALCVQLFSLGYMDDESPRGFGRYFTLQALFLFSMNALVVAPNLLQLFAGWEVVGLTSYLLIGFYFRKPSAARAAVKAFWMTKLADMGFLFGLLWLFTRTGSFEWTAAAPPAVATAVTALLFLAVMGKSAQFPLHVWLPDAMEGPTPVSALLHAATMVAAGIYLLVRADPLFAHAPATREAMLWIGAFTAIFAACLALVQSDIKKVLAYSTCSQLGYMVAALGAGVAYAGFFHLGTHAFFKALLFLAAGSIIHTIHSNELSDMGGLRKSMPLTTIAFAIGAFSLAGIPPFAGFFSKDLVIGALEGKDGWIPWGLLMATAFLTAFYMARVLMMAFFGEPSEKARHAHEPGLSMSIPVVLLAIPALFGGLLGGWLAHSMGVEPEAGGWSLTPIVASAIALAGLASGLVVFRGGRSLAAVSALERFASAGLVDRAWRILYGLGLRASDALGWIDRYFVDGVMNLLGYETIEAGGRLRRIQTGRIADYAAGVAVGAIFLIAIEAMR